jgi:predicted ATPase
VVYVLGDAGLGKSRLLNEARKTAPAGKVTWLEGQAVFMGQDLSYGPIKQILELDTGLVGVEDPSERIARLKDRLAELMPGEHDRHFTPIAALLSLLSPTATQNWQASSGGDLARERLQEALLRYFEGLCTRQPLVLVFEDCHWIDASSAAFIEYLLPLVEKTPLLLCLVARPKTESGLLSPERVTSRLESRYEEIRMSALDKDQSRHLVTELLGSNQLPTGLGPAIERQAGGNPFFIQEILRSLIETGGIEADGRGEWRLTGRLLPNLPDTLEAMIMARVDRLPEDTKRILRPASVVGDSFPEMLVLPLTGLSQTELKRNLQYLEDLEIVRSLETGPHPEYAFVHALIRDAVYGSVPARDRRALHTRVAEKIESSHAQLDGHYALLAHHYTKAEGWDRARDYLLKAADSAGKLGANEEADYYEQALETLLMSYREDIARAIHEAYVAANKDLIDADDPRMLPWDDLPEVYRDSNRRQADSHTTHLESVSCGFAPAKADPPCRVELTPDEVEFLAQREHERWWSQKRSAGYVFGPLRSDGERTHPSMVPWEELSEDEREKDRQAVREVPKRFADAGFRTYRASRGDPTE